MKRRLLLADVHQDQVRDIRDRLESEQLKVDVAGSLDQLKELFADKSYSIALIAVDVPSIDGLATIDMIQKRGIPTTILALTDARNENAAEAVRLGAYDYLARPVDKARLSILVSRILRERGLQDEVVHLRQQLKKHFSFHNLLSKNERMHEIFTMIANVGHSHATVLIEGETGTGKEQVARAIHQASPVREGPMIACNCAALPESLLESELFGHEKGAFTGALNQRLGRFELAHGGTLFLDEVGDIPQSMQAKLLRVLQERKIERLGGAAEIEVDVRIVAATNRSLHHMVQEKKFREDLYYRLNVVKIELPPLRERLEDLPLLVEVFVEKFSRPGEPAVRIDPRTMDRLLRYHWPGNIRELENAIERGCVTSMNGVILPDNLPAELTSDKPTRTPLAVDLNRSLPDLLRDVTRELECQYITKALELSEGNVGECARLCGLSRRSVTAKLADYGIDRLSIKRLARDSA